MFGDLDLLAVPASDGEVLVRPRGEELARLVAENRRRRSGYALRLLGRPASELGETLTGPLVVMTGHQPEFFHPGVWAKSVAASELARRLGGRAVFALVDTDSARGLMLRWPRYVAQPPSAMAESRKPKAESRQKDGGSSTTHPTPHPLPYGRGSYHHSSLMTHDSLWLEAGHCRVDSAAPFDLAGECSYDQLPRLPRERWREILNRLADAGQDLPPDSARFSSCVGAFADGFLASAPGGAAFPFAEDAAGVEFVPAWARGVAAVEEALGVVPPESSSVSRLFATGETPAPPEPLPDGRGSYPVCGGRDARPTRSRWAAAFVAHILLRAEAFARTYNEVLAEYRRRRGVRGRHHPVPDLAIQGGPLTGHVQGGRVEAPFWLIRPGQPRRRLYVAPRGADDVEVIAGPEAAATAEGGCATWEHVGMLNRKEAERDAAAAVRAGSGGWTIAPRALTLTMGLRLFACDLFIHGVGGAKYDRITDEIIRRFWGIEPPGYACVSATLHLPLPMFDAAETDAAMWRRKIRDFASNPQRYLREDDLRKIEAMLAERQAAIAESIRLRADAPRNRLARRAAYERIRHTNAAIGRSRPDWSPAAREELALVERRLAHNRIARSREWFFALYPPEMLAKLIRNLRSEVEALA